MTDTELRQAVLDELSFDPSIDAVHVAVTAEGGVVTLLGHVATFNEKHRAEKAAARVKGVRGIANDIEVKLPPNLRESDEAITHRAVQTLAWDAALPRDRIQVHVAHGFVTLTGEVDWRYQRQAAEDDVRKLHGVVMVANQITVRPRHDAAGPAEVRRKIVDALQRNLAETTAGITVETQGSTVKLSGKVHDWRERAAAERAAWSAPGVTHVEDKLVVA
ncbi:BON domain-containing protein [Acidisphaera rubrifaciens]|uniref:BON domain-containing protein n=1 Tax=Acidisphaera rubrifaciens HS-AP3 TaxID=1231350 RepID=A0A0D6P6J3_9PROT|nr:BON domain-containing protein [Acidisphaera rubrifaciens]GAN76494.1 hypothetical protein Asru_0104_17 [Acidisphaera rubrifaciens HS-AP3]